MAPLFVSNNLLGLNNNLYRVRTLSVNAVTAFDRDTVSLYVFSQEQTPVAVATAGQTAQKLDGISGGATWTHALSELSTASLHADYGTSSSKRLVSRRHRAVLQPVDLRRQCHA